MKKIIVSLSLLVVFLLSSCASEIIENETFESELNVVESVVVNSVKETIKIENEDFVDLSGISKELFEVFEKDKALNNKLDKAETELDMNEISAEIYKLWDDKLNDIWNRIKEKYDKNEWQKLVDDENAWIIMRDEQVKNAIKKYENGSIKNLMQNIESAKLTKDRVFSLSKILAVLNAEELNLDFLNNDNVENNNSMNVNKSNNITGEEKVKEYNKKGDYYIQYVSGNIVEGKQWKYEIKNSLMYLDDEMVNFYDLESKTEVGDFGYFFRAEKEGKEIVTWTLYDVKTNEEYYVVTLEFDIANVKNKDGYNSFTLISAKEKDMRSNNMSEYKFDEPNIMEHGEGNGG